jgi:hypothetical protein
MKDTRIVEILKSLGKEELKSFAQFLDSPFVKSRRNIKPLLEFLGNNHPDFETERITKERAFRKLFPGEAYNDKKLENLAIELSAAAEVFLIHSTVESDKTEALMNLCKGYYDRKMLNQSLRVMKIIEKKIVPGFSQGKDYFSKVRRLNYLKNGYYMEKDDIDNALECTRLTFEASAAQFIHDYAQLMSIKKAAGETYGKTIEGKFVGSVISHFDFDELFDAIKDSDFEYSLLIKILYYRYKLSEDPEDTRNYFFIKDLFYNNLEKFDRAEKNHIFNDLINYCVDRVKKTNDEFKSEGLEVYKKMLESSAYSESETEYMQVLTYRNIIIYCNMIKETDWLKTFIDNYTDTLSPEYRKDLANYAYGNLYFKMKDFEKALTFISKINHDFFLFKTDIKNLLLQIYFELNYIEQAYSLVDSYRHFLSNTKEIADGHKKTLEIFLKRYFELLRIKAGQSKEDIKYILNKIESETSLINRPWLLEKANDLSAKK